ncbi:hypothetical protein [Cupriavidus sp. WS]|uniref:hypothetical protein n=1 Tax=Cupriavidus sp. WS TaxID=1312922 RepID=UPI000372514B|nr:hypothetical protein [Cupriavidus sp. WS]
MTQADLVARLCDNHSFVRGAQFQPFGPNRGAVVAVRAHMLVMVLHTEGGTTWLSVAPSKEIQDLLWSFSNGYASQWSAMELKALSGCDDWNALQAMAHGQFAAAVRSLERAIAGMPEYDAPPVLDALDENTLELPPDYLQSVSLEDAPCVH